MLEKSEMASAGAPCGETCLALLADPTRRQILSQLRFGPSPVGQLAQGLPVSRPAVSQHLRMLSDAGLVRSEKCGTQRLYGVNPAGTRALQAYLDGLWGDVLGGFADHIKNSKESIMLPPIVKTIHVPVDPVEAFCVFTEQMGQWWPVASHSLSAGSGEVPKEIMVEPKVGGQVIETCADGKKRPWARVTAWQPGEKFAVRWHVGRDEDEATDVTVAFARVMGGCQVTLTHAGWEAMGDNAAAMRDGYLTGWDLVLVDQFGAACLAASPLAAE